MNTITTLWKTLANSKQITAVNTIQYAILRALFSETRDKVAMAKHLLHKSFTPITKPTKLANGARPYQALDRWINNARINGLSTFAGVPFSEILTPEQIAEFNAIYDECTPEKLVRHYSYFFTRQDLFDEYQLVQTAHAALELGNKLSAEQVRNLHFTCCGVRDREELEGLMGMLTALGIKYEAFYEPDIGNQVTSIALYPIREDKRSPFLKSFNLLRFRREVVAQPVSEQTITIRENS